LSPTSVTNERAKVATASQVIDYCPPPSLRSPTTYY
jgi:hypothetical protein